MIEDGVFISNNFKPDNTGKTIGVCLIIIIVILAIWIF